MIFIHSNYCPSNFGGIEKVVAELITIVKLQSNRNICFYGGQKSSFIFSDGISYISRRILFKFFGASFLSLGNIYFFWSARRATLIIFQEPYPTLWPAIFFLRVLYKIPIIFLVHANPVAPKIVMNLYSRLREFIFIGSVCVTTSPNLLKIVKSSKYVKNHCIPLSIPFDEASNKSPPVVSNRYVLYFGRMAEYKGIKDLLNAAALLPDIKFIIAGTGPLSYYIIEFIKSNSLNNVVFVNRLLSESEKLELIYGCEFLVFPSISENEAFGIVQLEAMRYSKAIVNTWLDSGVNFVAPNQVCALTVDRNSCAQLSNAIRILWSDEGLRTNLGANGYLRYLQYFSHQNFVKAWSNLIQDSYVKQ